MSKPIYELNIESLIDRKEGEQYLLVIHLDWLDEKAGWSFQEHAYLFDQWTFRSKKPKFVKEKDSHYKVTLEYDQHTDAETTETLGSLLVKGQWILYI